jgi:RAB protein geranylgeranyltransferase component A
VPILAAGEAEFGKLRDYAVDMVPKFIMAGGLLVKVPAARTDRS